MEKLEDRLNDIVAGIIAILETLVFEKRRREAAERLRLERILKQEEEEKRRAQLDNDSIQWERFNRISRYLDAYEASLLNGTKAWTH